MWDAFHDRDDLSLDQKIVRHKIEIAGIKNMPLREAIDWAATFSDKVYPYEIIAHLEYDAWLKEWF